MTHHKTGILTKMRRSEAGNVFFALFGAVGLVGVLGAAAMTVLKGPVTGMQRVTKYTVAENNMIAAAKLALIAATNQAGDGDCDGDGMIEPVPFSSTGDGPFPVGGGYLPPDVGAARQDPWGNIFGYCVWDHGIDPDDPTDNDGQCVATSNMRAGADSEQYIAIAVISSGPDRIFQTSCNNFNPAAPALPLVVKPSGSDDLVLGYTYAEAGSMSGGLWKLKSGDAETAEVGRRNIEVAGSQGTDAARIGYDEDLGLSGVGEFLALKTDNIYARTPNGEVMMQSPLRVQRVSGLLEPDDGAGGGGGGSQSVIAPGLRKLTPDMPLAPDGKDWADALVCGQVVFTLNVYNHGDANYNLLYSYNATSTSTYMYTYYNKAGTRTQNIGGGLCPATYAAATKIYYGGGGGGGSGGGDAVFVCTNEESNNNGTGDKPECVAAAQQLSHPTSGSGLGDYAFLQCRRTTDNLLTSGVPGSWVVAAGQWRVWGGSSWLVCVDGTVQIVDVNKLGGGGGGGSGSLWTQSGDDIYYNAGNVGIGTDSPAAKLHVSGGGIHVTQMAGDGLALKIEERPTQYGSKVAWLDENQQVASAITKGPSDDLRFYTGGAHAGGNEKMTITAAGSVGIGTHLPSAPLQVVGNVTATGFTGSGANLTNLNAAQLATGTVPTARLGSGTANNTTFLRGDGTWTAPTGGGISEVITAQCTTTGGGCYWVFENYVCNPSSCTVNCPATYFRTGCTGGTNNDISGTTGCICGGASGGGTLCRAICAK